jgi:hypothetical protein
VFGLYGVHDGLEWLDASDGRASLAAGPVGGSSSHSSKYSFPVPSRPQSQKTPNGHEFPVPTRNEVYEALERMAKPNRGSELPKGLAAPARRALTQAGFTSLEQFTEMTEAEVRQLHGIGGRAVYQIRLALTARDLTFKD